MIDPPPCPFITHAASWLRKKSPFSQFNVRGDNIESAEFLRYFFDEGLRILRPGDVGRNGHSGYPFRTDLLRHGIEPLDLTDTDKNLLLRELRIRKMVLYVKLIFDEQLIFDEPVKSRRCHPELVEG
jgi:hypothetical protein